MFVSIQIETRGALDAAEAIAAIDGVDLLFVGPSDLSAELGAIGQPNHPKVLEACEHVDAACKKHGKAWGTIAVDPTFADRCAAMSRCRMLTFGNDCRAMRDGIAAVKKTFGSQFT